MTARILVGACSWADKTLVDSGWYPPEAKSAEERLRYYAEQFPIVEVDSTYYGLPSERNAALWVERTPDDFTFDIKSYALFTHHPAALRSLPKDLREALPPALQEKRPDGRPSGRNLYYRDTPPELRDELWSRFTSALLPLDSAGKLGTVLFQFPPWFLPGRDSTDYILEANERLGQYTMAVEFRNDRWLSERNQERTLKLLTDNAIPLVCVDEPQGFRSSVPPLVVVTAPVALLRMHGRNYETWEKKGITAAERFNYLYSEEELQEWTPRVQRLAEGSREVHVLMNNCHHDYAVRNARQLADRLGLPAGRHGARGPKQAARDTDAQRRLL
ncbi:MAG: DUF72 domain-containing protein [Chloroflexi bacterium]|nr:DUF72 domain-containing protein [Chloroflexota bacterium]